MQLYQLTIKNRHGFTVTTHHATPQSLHFAIEHTPGTAVDVQPVRVQANDEGGKRRKEPRVNRHA